MSQTSPLVELLEDMAKVSRKIRTVFHARVREQGLTLARARTLLRIARGEAANQKELADDLEIETATLVRLIDGLEAQGLIARQEVEGDRRAKQAVPTAQGMELAKVVEAMVHQIAQEVLAGISDRDRQATHDAIRRMAGNIEGAAAPEPAR